MPELRPFHETIVDAIRSVRNKDLVQLALLGNLIRGTRIPAGHDEIIAAWREQVVGTHLLEWGPGLDVVVSILAQKPKPMTEEEMINETLLRR